MTPRSPFKVSQLFGRTYCLHYVIIKILGFHGGEDLCSGLLARYLEVYCIPAPFNMVTIVVRRKSWSPLGGQ
jgi:hypothetical protein